ncbi:MAG: DUF1178 family protein [Alphaproteobacteria bacterium]|nr:MAG: DUF1178 family protein [Alphaproteobacteria bacterium]
MIRYKLRCEKEHDFESWFPSARAFDRLSEAGQLTCPVCGSHDVRKAPMAPQVVTSEAAERPEEERAALRSEAERRLAELRRQVEEESEYVGPEFAEEARRIHAGEAPNRQIWGETSPEEARKLHEEGVPVLPLPWIPSRKVS